MCVSVMRWTRKRRAISDCEYPRDCISPISASRPVSLTRALFRPFGRPSTTPSARFRASASLVRSDIRFRSISAEMPNANASTLDWMSSPNL